MPPRALFGCAPRPTGRGSSGPWPVFPIAPRGREAKRPRRACSPRPSLRLERHPQGKSPRLLRCRFAPRFAWSANVPVGFVVPRRTSAFRGACLLWGNGVWPRCLGPRGGRSIRNEAARRAMQDDREGDALHGVGRSYHNSCTLPLTGPTKRRSSFISSGSASKVMIGGITRKASNVFL